MESIDAHILIHKSNKDIPVMILSRFAEIGPDDNCEEVYKILLEINMVQMEFSMAVSDDNDIYCSKNVYLKYLSDEYLDTLLAGLNLLNPQVHIELLQNGVKTNEIL